MNELTEALYFDCNSGISGDMTVAALLDLGADREVLDRALASLPVNGFHARVSRVQKAGLDACDFYVELEQDNQDHDMEYLHGRNENPPVSHNHAHRGLAEIKAIIQQMDAEVGAKELAIRIFTILAQAEAKAHGVPLSQVHFHEVGAVDSIVDIVAAAVCLDNLNIRKVIVPKLCEGTGTVRCQHGVLPIPAPAVLNIAASHQLNLEIVEEKGEFVTPTGAAIVAAIKTHDRLPKTFQVEKIGIGAGKREYERPGILRVMRIRESITLRDQIYKLETNIDDCSGEVMGYVMGLLLEAGARDVHYMPVYMKKNRPAYQLNIICDEADIPRMEQILFKETTTIGVRRAAMERTVLKREIRKVKTPLGMAIVKVCDLPEGKRFYPEYDNVIALCKANHMSYMDVYNEIQRQCQILQEGGQEG